MKRIISSLLAASICVAPLSIPMIVSPSWAQSRSLQSTELKRLIQQGRKYNQKQPKRAIETWQKALVIARQDKLKEFEALILLFIGSNYSDIGQPQKALEFYNQSLKIDREVGNRSGEATTLNNIGLVYSNIGQLQKALEFYNQALKIDREVGDRRGQAIILNNIGVVYKNIGQPQKALEFYNQSLTIDREVGDRSGEGIALNNIGLIYSKIGQPQKALEFLNQSLAIDREVGDRSSEATTLNNIGLVYSNIGQPQKALEFYNQALPIRREVGDRSGEAITLNNIGTHYNKIGQPQKALKFLNQALPIRREVGDLGGEATTLTNIGLIYAQIGQPQKALILHILALQITRQVGNRSVEAATLNNIGIIYSQNGQPQKALEFYNQALPIRREAVDHRGQVATLHNIGSVYNKIGQPQKALEFLNQALPITRQVDDRSGEATILNSIGAVYNKIEQPQKALKFYNQALLIRREVGDRSGEATTLKNIGAVYSRIGQPQKAIANLEESVKIKLEIRSGLQRQNRKQFLNTEKGTAIVLTDLLIDQNQPSSAYEWINLVNTAELADYTRLINAKVSNTEAQKALDNWNQKNQQLEALRQGLQNNFSDELVRKMRNLEAEVNKQAEEISHKFPEVADLFETTPTDIAKLRASIAKGTVVIHPVFLTNISNVPNNVAIFVLTKDKLTVVKKSVNARELDQLIKDYHSQLEDRKNTDYLVTSTKLYDILIRPVEKQIQKYSPKQLSVITSGKLRYIPFETLRDSKTDKYLIEKYPINYLTRLSTRNQPDKDQTKNWWSKIIDSIFSFLNTALPFLNQQNTGALTIANPQPTKVNLPGTEEEARIIIKNIPNSEVYIGNQATLENFKNQAPRFKFLHLGTHGCFDLAGCENLGMKANTLLFANNEQYNIADAALLGLQNTELITLGACQTAKEIDDNGQVIPGLAYIFERAGAKAIIASIWNAPDTASKDIMIEFYANLKRKKSKSEALRRAKLSQINRHPFFWSPFILIGDGS